MTLVTRNELFSLLEEPETRATVKRLLDLPPEPVAGELRELRSDIRELIRGQARTDQSVQELMLAVKDLTAAQARTDDSTKTLFAAQARTDESIRELSAAQARTDESIKELSSAQARTDESIKELSAAQARTDHNVHALRREVGALSDNVGYGLEELAALLLPEWLEREEGVTVQGFMRRFFPTAEGEEEVDLYADGDRAGTFVPVVGEVKSRIYSGDVKKFAVKLRRVAEALPQRPVGLMLGFVVHPAAKDVAREVGVHVLASRPSMR